MSYIPRAKALLISEFFLVHWVVNMGYKYVASFVAAGHMYPWAPEYIYT